jgi:hypothetical protein
MVRPLASLLGWMTLLGAVACASTVQTQPPGRPPTPTSVTRANPGGDADDPERAALERLAGEPWGYRRDRFNTLRVPLADGQHWQRIKLLGYPTRATYRFGDQHYAMIGIWYTPIEGDNDPDTCLDKLLAEALPVAEAYGVRVGETQLVRTEQRVENEERPLLIKLMEGSYESLFESNDYVGALAAYQSWPGTCLVEGFAVVATKHRALAIKVRDRWVAEGLPKLAWDKKIFEAPPTTAVH